MVKGYGARMQAPDYVAKLVSTGRKGKKSGGGFYDFSEKGSTPVQGLRDLLGVAKPPITAANRKDIADRLILRLINEAVQCLDEGVAGAPGLEAANQVDLGTVMGIGFPPFRGGVLYYAEKLGARNVADTLTRLAQKHGERFAPWSGISKRAEQNGSFLAAA
jgi:3-hydroxyacyl-CoA dehydrogenase/enoyl-CoA hydratase/3-hydroxybutyryl-CoA epimerase